MIEDAREEKERKYLGPLEEDAEGKSSLGPDLALEAGIGSSGGGPDEDLVRRRRLEREEVGGRKDGIEKIPSPPGPSLTETRMVGSTDGCVGTTGHPE